MNIKQKIALWVGFALVLATGAYPPWRQSWAWDFPKYDVRIGAGAEGYSWIHRPPQVPRWVNEEIRSPDFVNRVWEKAFLTSIRIAGYWRSQIDITRLLIEWAVIMSGTLCAVLTLAGKRRQPYPDGNLSEFAGLDLR